MTPRPLARSLVVASACAFVLPLFPLSTMPNVRSKSNPRDRLGANTLLRVNARTAEPPNQARTAPLAEALQRLQTELKRMRSRYRELFEHVPIGLVDIDPLGRIVDCNAAVSAMLRCDRSGVVGRRLSQFADAEESYGLRCIIRQAFVESRFERHEIAMHRSDARRFRAEICMLHVGDLADPTPCARLTIADLTDARASGSGVIELAEYLHLAAKIDAASAAAAETAHDARNLLYGVAGCAAAALGEPDLPDRARACLTGIADAIRRGGELVERINAFVDDACGHPRPVEIDELVEGCAALLRGMVGPHIVLQFDLAAPGAWVCADPVQLQRILLNLASNARDAMTEGGVLEIGTRTSTLNRNRADASDLPNVREHVVLRVRDSGVGMTEPIRRRIFEPFFTTKHSPDSRAGLGLASVATIMGKLDGQIEVTTQPAAGTTFTLSFPAFRDESLR